MTLLKSSEEGNMFRVYDKINDYEYARGNTIEELINNWNEQVEEKFSWILETENTQDFYNSVTEKCYRIENIYQIMDIVNNVEVNDLKLYKDKEVYNEI